MKGRSQPVNSELQQLNRRAKFQRREEKLQLLFEKHEEEEEELNETICLVV